MIELVEIGGIVVEREAVDQAGVEIGGIEVAARGIESQSTDAGTAVGDAGERRVGKERACPVVPSIF